MIFALLLLGWTTVQRLGELVVASRNTAALKARGGVEAGASHYPVMVAMHAAWLAGLWLLAWDRPVNWQVNWPWAAAFAVGQALRFWTLCVLGRRWTTRIIVVPGETLVHAGPYRFLSHPNYVAVSIEIAALPLAFGLVAYAIVFSLLNLAMLWVRIREENRALTGAASRAG